MKKVQQDVSEIVYTSESGDKYTKQDIMDIIKEHLQWYERDYNPEIIYNNLMSVIEWQHPATVLVEMENEDDYGSPYYQPEND